MGKRFAVSVCVVLMAWSFAAQGQIQATVEPHEIRAARGETIAVRVTPAGVPDGLAIVAFKLCPSNAVHGILAQNDAQPWVLSTHDGSGFPAVDLPVRLDAGARIGKFPVRLIAEALPEGHMPGVGASPPVRIERAFMMEISGGSGDFAFTIGSTNQIRPQGSGAAVTVDAPGRVAIPLVIEPRDGFSGTVHITKSVTDASTFVVTKDCPPEGSPDCMFETLPVEVSGQVVSEQVLLSPTPSANSGQVIFTATAEGLPPKQAILDVTIRKSGPSMPLGPGGQPCDVQRGLNCFLVDPADGNISIKAGETKTIRFNIKRTDVAGKPTPAFVTLAASELDERLEWLTNDARIEPGHQYGEVEIKAKPGAAPGPANLMLDVTAPDLVRAEDAHSGKDSLALSINVLPGDPVAPTPAGPDFSLRFEPAEIALVPGGERKTVKLFLTRAADQRYGVTLQWPDRDPRVEIPSDYAHDVFQLDQLIKEFPISAPAGSEPGRIELTVLGTGTIGQQEERRTAEAKLVVNLSKVAAAVITSAEPNRFEMKPGESRTVTLQFAGDRGWNGALDATVSTEGGAQVTPSSFTVPSTPGTQEITVTAPATGEPQQRMNLQVRLREHGEQRIIAEQNVFIRLAVAAVPQYTLSVTQPMLIVPTSRPGVITVKVAGVNGWNGPVSIGVENVPEWATVVPLTQEVRSLPAELNFQVSRLAHTGAPTRLLFRGVAEGVEKTAEMPVELSIGGGPITPPVRQPRPGSPGRIGGDPDRGVPFEREQMEVEIPFEFKTAASSIASSHSVLNGLGSSVLDDHVIDPAKAKAQMGFLLFYEALIADAQSMAALKPGEDLDGLDGAVLARMIEESGALRQAGERRPPDAQIATQGLPLMIINWEAELERPQPGKNLAWPTYSPVEKLIQQMRIGQMAGGAQMVTGPMIDVLNALDSAIENLGLEDVKKAKKAIKQLAIASAVVHVADIVAKAGVAFMPNRITALYAEINGVNREKDAAPPVIAVGEYANLKVFIVSESPGGRIVTPFQVAEWVWGKVSNSRKVQEKLDAIEKDELKKAIYDEFTARLKQVWGVAASVPEVKAWLDATEAAWDVPPFKNPKLEVNSKRVVHMQSRSSALLSVDEDPASPAAERAFRMKGLADSGNGTAGYDFGLQSYLVRELSGVSHGVALSRQGVVKVAGPKGPCFPKTQPADYGRQCRYLDGSDKWVTCPAGTYCPGVVTCENDCAYPK